MRRARRLSSDRSRATPLSGGLGTTTPRRRPTKMGGRRGFNNIARPKSRVKNR